MSIYHSRIAAIVRRDPRYAYEAYEFVFAALAHTQGAHGRDPDGAAEAPASHPIPPELGQSVTSVGIARFLLEFASSAVKIPHPRNGEGSPPSGF